MTDDRLRVLVWHIRDVASEIAAFIAGSSRAERRTSSWSAVWYTASTSLPTWQTRLQNEHPEFVASLPEIAWRDIRGLRNRVAHSYFEINYDIIWDAAVGEVPVLAALLMAKLDEAPHTAT